MTMDPICTIYARCGFTRLVIKQTRSGLYYYVKHDHEAHWTRIQPNEVLEYVPSVEDLDTSVWFFHRRRNEWQYLEGLPVTYERPKKQKNP